MKKMSLSKRDEHDREIIANADYFNATATTGGGFMERHWCSSKEEAFELAQDFATRNKRIYMVYAVRGQQGCHVRNFYPD